MLLLSISNPRLINVYLLLSCISFPLLFSSITLCLSKGDFIIMDLGELPFFGFGDVQNKRRFVEEFRIRFHMQRERRRKSHVIQREKVKVKLFFFFFFLCMHDNIFLI